MVVLLLLRILLSLHAPQRRLFFVFSVSMPLNAGCSLYSLYVKSRIDNLCATWHLLNMYVIPIRYWGYISRL
uniref:Uncharacterized protein n=1 Tax=Hordeum vulgare subsp. vulgare TaxID=112509 RepID=A0A8I6XQK3_HORVV